MSKNNYSRRKFLTTSSVALTAVTFCGIAIAEAPTPDSAKLSEDDPMAIALGYKHIADDIDKEKFPRRLSTADVKQTCRNCTLFMNHTDLDAEWAPCSIFQNKLVASAGWCSTWIVKP